MAEACSDIAPVITHFRRKRRGLHSKVESSSRPDSLELSSVHGAEYSPVSGDTGTQNGPSEPSELTDNFENSSSRSREADSDDGGTLLHDWLQSTQAIDDGTAIFSDTNGEKWLKHTENCRTCPGVVDGLCIKCWWILDHLRYILSCRDEMESVIFLEHWAMFCQLVQAAAAGCKLCKTIQLSISWENNAPLSDAPPQFWIYISESLVLYCKSGNTGAVRIRFVPVGISALKIHNSKASNQPVDKEITDLAISWLKQCENRHAACRRKYSSVTLPSRLLEIKPESLRLQTTTDLPKDTKYATLSHCWGEKGVDFKLTKDLLETFQTGVNQDSLSKTFEEAIVITRRLGLEYLWIDSLCIVQDDPEDWQSESVTMSEVYGNSYVNIAAAAAKDGTEGCFNFHTRVGSLQVQARAVGSEQECFLTLEVFPREMSHPAMSQNPLSSRAWVLQERLLSPRTLHFTSDQLFFECDTQLGCESFPNGIPAFMYQRRSDIILIDKGDLSNQWSEIIRSYSRCKLTQRGDVLVALSGIIRKLEKLRQDQCIAGIWRQDPESQLLWRRAEPEDAQMEHELYTAPSWSWASSPGAVTANWSTEPVEGWAVQVLSMYVEPVGTDPLGKLRGGSLSIACGKMVQAQILSQVESHGGTATVVAFPTTRAQSLCEISWDILNPGCTYIFFLSFYRDAESYSRGLVLVATGKERGQYGRVGHFVTAYLTADGLENPVQSQDALTDPSNHAGKEAFAGSFHHEDECVEGGEEWGVITII